MKLKILPREFEGSFWGKNSTEHTSKRCQAIPALKCHNCTTILTLIFFLEKKDPDLCCKRKWIKEPKITHSNEPSETTGVDRINPAFKQIDPKDVTDPQHPFWRPCFSLLSSLAVYCVTALPSPIYLFVFIRVLHLFSYCWIDSTPSGSHCKVALRRVRQSHIRPVHSGKVGRQTFSLTSLTYTEWVVVWWGIGVSGKWRGENNKKKYCPPWSTGRAHCTVENAPVRGVLWKIIIRTNIGQFSSHGRLSQSVHCNRILFSSFSPRDESTHTQSHNGLCVSKNKTGKKRRKKTNIARWSTAVGPRCIVPRCSVTLAPPPCKQTVRYESNKPIKSKLTYRQINQSINQPRGPTTKCFHHRNSWLIDWLIDCTEYRQVFCSGSLLFPLPLCIKRKKGTKIVMRMRNQKERRS